MKIDFKERIFRKQTVLAISIKDESYNFVKQHRVYAFPNIIRSYSYIKKLFKDMYIVFMHNGEMERIYKVDNYYFLNPHTILHNEHFGVKFRHKESIHNFTVDRFNSPLGFSQPQQEYVYLTFYPTDRDIDLPHTPKYLVNGKPHQGFTYFSFEDLTSGISYVLPETIMLRKRRQLSRTTEEYQSEIENALITENEPIEVEQDHPHPKPPKSQTNQSSYVRNQKVGRNAIIRANFKCEFDNSHHDFISAMTKQNYVEAHHLIPIEFQDYFDVSLDVEANVVSLCSTCHKKIHHATLDVRKEIVQKLFQERQSRLSECEIVVNFQKLFSYYR